MPQTQSNEKSSLSSAASTVGAARGAIKAGKAIAGAAKGAAAGPYGMLAGALWENRKIIGKILIAAISLLMLPILFILMLPSLIFGGLTSGTDSGNVLNDNTLIMKNIAEDEAVIEEVLRSKHDKLLEEIRTKGNALGTDCEYIITDDFADKIIFESFLIISQYSASEENYKDVSVASLKKTLEDNADGIFSYTTNISTREETVDEETGETKTITCYEYVIEYAGSTYFSEKIFRLTEEQSAFAANYANNLNIFFFDAAYQIEINPELIPRETGNAAVDLALTKIGTPYSQARRNQKGYFDCSSFTYWVYSQLGTSLSYNGSNTAAAQGRYLVENNLVVGYDSLAPGDLILYSFENNHRFMNISHIAIYYGNGYVVDASFSHGKVIYRPIYSTNKIVLCGRPYVK